MEQLERWREAELGAEGAVAAVLDRIAEEVDACEARRAERADQLACCSAVAQCWLLVRAATLTAQVRGPTLAVGEEPTRGEIDVHANFRVDLRHVPKPKLSKNNVPSRRALYYSRTPSDRSVGSTASFRKKNDRPATTFGAVAKGTLEQIRWRRFSHVSLFSQRTEAMNLSADLMDPQARRLGEQG